MRAAVVDRYGPPSVVQLREIPDPTPGRREVLVRVTAAAVTSGDARIRGAHFPRGFAAAARLGLGLRGPRRPVLGVAFAGVIVTDTAADSGLPVGTRVAGMTGAGMGAHAELLAVAARKLVRIPDGVSDADAAAALFGGTTALHFLRDLVHPGTSVLVNGAAGSVGSAAVQLAASAGASVTAVTREANNELVHRLGAEHTIDYTTQAIAELAGRYDVVLDAVGNLDVPSGRRLLTDTGILLLPVASLGDTVRSRKDVRTGSAPELPSDMTQLLAAVEAGAFDPLTEIVGGLDAITAAYERVDSGHKVGNLVIEPQR